MYNHFCMYRMLEKASFLVAIPPEASSSRGRGGEGWCSLKASWDTREEGLMRNEGLMELVARSCNTHGLNELYFHRSQNLSPRLTRLLLLNWITNLVVTVYVCIYTTLIKKFSKFIQKIQNTVLFIKSDIVLFKVLPIDCNALMPALDPALETFLELYCRYSHQNRLRLFHYLLSAVKTRSP